MLHLCFLLLLWYFQASAAAVPALDRPESGCIFTKVKAQGSLFGKDRYLQFYRLTPGEQFDQEKHIHSIDRIRQAFKDEGYLEPRITDTVSYDKKSRTVSVSLSFNPGTQYRIETVNIGVPGAYKELITELQEMADSALLGSYAVKERIDQQARLMGELLRKKGYSKSKIALTTTHDKIGKAFLSFSITLSEKKQLLFEGNAFFSADQLHDELFSHEADGVLLPPELLVEDLELLYKRKGFFNIAVSWREKRDSLTLIIREGERARPWMKGVVVTYGGHKPTEPTAMAVLQKVIAAINALNYYDADEIATIVQKGISKLVRKGYWDAAISFKDPEDVAPFTLSVKLGLRRMANTIAIKGFPELDPLLDKEEILSRWRHRKKAKIVTPDTVEEQRSWLLAFLKQRGFLYATAHESFVKNDNGITLLWTIDTKKGPVRFGPTKIVGLRRMKPEIVYRELAYRAGDVWNRACIEQTAKRLKCLEMFDSVSIAPDTSAGITTPIEQPLIITCIEDDPFEVKTRLGVQLVSRSFTQLSWTTFKIGGSFVWKNPAGIADRLYLDAELTRYSRDLSAAYELPWIGPLPIRTQMRIYSYRFDQPLIGSDSNRLYKEAHDGASITFNHSHPWWESSWKMGLELNKLSGISPQLARVIQFEPSLVDQRTPYLYWEPKVIFEARDNKADPCKGVYTSLGCKVMVPPGVSNGWFVKAEVEQALFYPLYRSIIGALRWRLGHIFNAKFSTILPTERFYLGGATSLRGYETNMVPPLNDLTCDGRCVWVPVGGKSMANLNAEIRFPIYRWFRGVVFTDMGVLTQDKFADIAANKWLGASGLGLRVATPIGPVRFDIGWKWHKRDPRDRRYAWFLTFGHAF